MQPEPFLSAFLAHAHPRLKFAVCDRQFLLGGIDLLLGFGRQSLDVAIECLERLLALRLGEVIQGGERRARDLLDFLAHACPRGGRRGNPDGLQQRGGACLQLRADGLFATGNFP